MQNYLPGLVTKLALVLELLQKVVGTTLPPSMVRVNESLSKGCRPLGARENCA